MSQLLDFWFDFSSPYAYLGATQVEALAARTGATLRWQPMLLGALFKAIGQADAPIATYSAQKAIHTRADLLRWADHYGVPFAWPSRFPIRTLAPLRVTLLLQGPDRAHWIQRVFRAYWAEDLDLTSPIILSGLLSELGLPAYLLEATATDAVKKALADQTAQAEALGVFGAPTYIVGDALFWGQDRVPLVERALLSQ